jgi:hypothetical protein
VGFGPVPALTGKRAELPQPASVTITAATKQRWRVPTVRDVMEAVG